MEHERPGHLLALTGKIVALVAFVAILLAPRPSGLSPEAHRLAAVTALMVALWLTDAIPIAATALIPLAAYPLLGIRTAKVVSAQYLDENVFLFFGGFVIALGIEKWGLHRRIALHIVRLVGAGSRRIVLGFMLATALLSMWISNTAATLLMLPIGLALLTALDEATRPTAGAAVDPLEPYSRDRTLARLGTALMLGIAYAASLGGLCTTVGTPTNLVMLGIWSGREDMVARYGNFSLGTWMAAFVPFSCAMLVAAWLVLTLRMKPLPGAERLERTFFTERIHDLGRPSRPEWTMLAVFLLTAGLWIFRAPLRIGDVDILPAWGPPVQKFLRDALHADAAFAGSSAIHDSTVAWLMALLLFLLPAGRDADGQRRPMMDWETVHRGVPWGILLLFGGGLAMAEAFVATGLSAWTGAWLVAEGVGLSPVWLVLGTCLLMTFLTEFTSNVATVSALAPILIDASAGLNIDPRLLLLPATVSASCAFMLPIATPPNAIVFGSGRVTMRQMIVHGFSLNLIGAVLATIATFTLLCPLLGIEW